MPKCDHVRNKFICEKTLYNFFSLKFKVCLMDQNVNYLGECSM